LHDLNHIKPTDQKSIHDVLAPYWAIALVVLGSTALATNWIDLGSFWKGYVLDMTGPAWNYILFRGLYTSRKDNAWSRFFLCAGIESAQFKII
jgi:hypothetical protein